RLAADRRRHRKHPLSGARTVIGRAWRHAADRLRAVFGSGDDREFDAEMDEHLRQLAERYVRQGLTSEAAAFAARRQFGSTTRLREERREMQTGRALEAPWIHVRFTAPGPPKAPPVPAAPAITPRPCVG